MTTITEPAQSATDRLTVADLAQIHDYEHLHELVDGALVTMPRPKYRHGIVSGKLTALIGTHVYTHQLGEVATESGFILASNPDVVRGPDIAFIAASRVPAEEERDAYFVGAPDLVVEIVSPGDSALDLRTRISQYLAAGAQLIWVIYPQLKLVDVYRADKSIAVLYAQDVLDGEMVLPGLHIPVRMLFE